MHAKLRDARGRNRKERKRMSGVRGNPDYRCTLQREEKHLTNSLISALYFTFIFNFWFRLFFFPALQYAISFLDKTISASHQHTSAGNSEQVNNPQATHHERLAIVISFDISKFTRKRTVPDQRTESGRRGRCDRKLAFYKLLLRLLFVSFSQPSFCNRVESLRIRIWITCTTVVRKQKINVITGIVVCVSHIFFWITLEHLFRQIIFIIIFWNIQLNVTIF